MFSAFSTALSGLSADSTAVDVVGNNLANLNTTGFKASDVSFHDLVNQALTGTRNDPGFGVAAPNIVQVYSQGAVQASNGPYDAAIQGDGFFVLSDSNGNQLLTRNGNFSVDANGNLLTRSGEHVQGWDATSGAIDTAAPAGNIVIPSGVLNAPVPTSNISTQVNLDASQPVGATFATTIPVYDSLGETHNIQIQFQKTAANSWTYTATVPGADLTSGTAGTPSQVATDSLAFDSQGNLQTPAPPPSGNASIPLALQGLSDGAADLNLNWNIWNTSGPTPTSMLTQIASASSASSPTQDGSAAAEIASVTVGAHGQITAQYAGGQPKVIAQLAVATVRDPETLVSAGNGNLELSTATSLASIGVPNTGGRGDIIGGALEASTVDIAREFTNLIVFQRSYEANGKVVTTADTLSQDTINLIR